MPLYTFEEIQKIPASIQQVWDFISSPKNLKLITPEHMGFDIMTNNLPSTMYPGMIIKYKVSPLWNVKTTWVTEITTANRIIMKTSVATVTLSTMSV